MDSSKSGIYHLLGIRHSVWKWICDMFKTLHFMFLCDSPSYGPHFNNRIQRDYVNDDIVDHGLSSSYVTIVCTSLFEWSQISISTILENNFDNGDDQPFIPIPSSHYWESFHVGRGKGPCLSIDVCLICMDPGVVVRDLQKQHNDVETDWMQRERELAGQVSIKHS